MPQAQKLLLQSLLMKAGIAPEMAESLMKLPIKVTATKTNSSGGIDAVGTDANGNLKVYNLKGISNATSEEELSFNRIIQGVGNINDLTPSVRTKVENKILQAGLWEETPAQWFKTQIEQSAQKSFPAEIIKGLWDEWRNPILKSLQSTTKSTNNNSTEDEEIFK